MRAIVRHQDLIDLSTKKGIYPYDMINIYGIMFTVKLISSLVKKNKKNKFKTISLPYPKRLTKESDIEKYLDVLRESGFKITSWCEDLIDEETGEIVEVQRWKIFFLN
jgi:hypothetical protein